MLSRSIGVFAYNMSVMTCLPARQVRQNKNKFRTQEHFTLLNLSCRITYLTGQAFIDCFISVPAKITRSGHHIELKTDETSMIKIFKHTRG